MRPLPALLLLVSLPSTVGCKSEPKEHHIAGFVVTAPSSWSAELSVEDDYAELSFDSWFDDGLCMVQVLEGEVAKEDYFEIVSAQFGAPLATGTQEARTLEAPLGRMQGVSYRGRVPDTGGVVGSVAKLAGPVRLEHYALQHGPRLVSGTVMTFEDDARAAEKVRQKCHAVLRSLRPEGVAAVAPAADAR